MTTKLSIQELIAQKKLQQQQRQYLQEQQEQQQQEQQEQQKLKQAIEAAKAEIPLNPTTPKKTLQQLIAEKLNKTEERKEKETFSLSITLNKEQLLAKEMAMAGKSFCLVGAAGTGKTTVQREIAAALLKSGSLSRHEFRIQGTGQRIDAPSIAFIAYTRIASGNLRKAIHKDPILEQTLANNITTIHNLLEYSPETYWNTEKQKECFRFVPKRNKGNPLDITHLVIEEASMIGLDLGQKLMDALRCGVQIIYIGDINQLPPIFGDSILNYALTQLPVIELTQVYRQEEGSTILENAHRILKGEKKLIEAPDFQIIRGGNIQHSQTKLAQVLGKQFPIWKEKGIYNPDRDIVLSPWNKQDLGTNNLNKWIAQFLGTERKAIVHEIIAGMSKHYLAVGDKVMVNRQVGYITKISYNGLYMGRSPLSPSTTLTRFGSYTGETEENVPFEEIDYSNLDLDRLLEMEEKGEDIKREASHIVEVLLDTGEEVTLSTVGDFSPNVFSLAYALTIHKAQGCEWEKVFIILHRDHAVSLYRELLYTAVTRAREKVILIAKDHVIEKAITTQRIKGNSVEEKIAFFNSGAKLTQSFFCTK